MAGTARSWSQEPIPQTSGQPMSSAQRFFSYHLLLVVLVLVLGRRLIHTVGGYESGPAFQHPPTPTPNDYPRTYQNCRRMALATVSSRETM